MDVAALRFSVTSLLRQSYAKLPKGAGYPVVEGGEVTGGARMHQEQQLLLTYQVNGDMPPEMLKKLVSGNVVRRLQLLDGVERVEVAGTTDKYVEVGYDPMALAACGITSQDLQDGIRNFLGKDEVVGTMLHTTADSRKERIAFRLKRHAMESRLLMFPSRSMAIVWFISMIWLGFMSSDMSLLAFIV